MSSFTQDQVRTFRQIFSLFNDEERGGLPRENFVPAVSESLEHCNLSSQPSEVYLAGEFNRLAGDSGVVNWQQFFQVLIHINLQFGQGSSSAPQDPPPPEIFPATHSSPRVQFTPSTIDPVPDVPTAPPREQRSIGVTLRRGAGIIGNALGDFFGVTEVSQRGTTDGRIGWEQYTERRAEEESGSGVFGTLARRASVGARRRASQRGYPANEPPPDYPAVSSGRSFNLDELGDSDDDNAFTAEAPPDYNDLIAQDDPWLPAGGVALETSLMLREEPQQYPVSTRPADGVEAPPTLPPRGDLIFDKDQAWDHYQKFIKAEKKLRQRRHRNDAIEFFGSTDVAGSGPDHQEGVRRERLASLDQVAGQEVQRRRKKKRKTKLQRQSTLIRREVESLPTFWPVFIILLSIGQVAGMIVLLALPTIGLAPIKPFPIPNTEEFPSLLAPNLEANVTYYRGVNLWIGPSATNLIRFGAKFTPCMRTDFGILRRNADLYFNPIANGLVGCCQNQIHQGSVVLEECVTSLENVTLNGTVSFDPGNEADQGRCANETFVNFHPCCISITGLCEVMDSTQCNARGGFPHTEADTCDQVNCLRDICQFNGVGIGEETDSNGNPNPNRPRAQQFWRWFTSLFIHLGVIHIIIIIPIQLYVGIKIERTIGWLRIGLIYLISGVGGNIISAIFVPYGVNAGASGAVFGLLAVLYVELFQFWQIVDRAYLELLKLTAFVVFLLALGTLPYVDNMAHIGGLLFGVPSAIIFVPYITFGKWDTFRKRILLIICVPLLLALLLAGFFTFYFIPDPNFCSFCHYINCVPYVSGFCPEEFNNPNPTVFSL